MGGRNFGGNWWEKYTNGGQSNNQQNFNPNPYNMQVPDTGKWVHNPASQDQISAFQATHPDALTSLVSNTAAVDLNAYNQDPFGFMMKYYGAEQTKKLYERGMMTAYGVRGQMPTTHFAANDKFFADYERYFGGRQQSSNGMPSYWGGAGGGGGCHGGAGGCHGGGGNTPSVPTTPTKEQPTVFTSTLSAAPTGKLGVTLGDLPASPYDTKANGLDKLTTTKGGTKKYKKETSKKSVEELDALGITLPSFSFLGVNV